MPIRFRCAYCNQLMGIARRKAGTVVRCPTCGGQVVVPTPEPPIQPVQLPPAPGNGPPPPPNLFEQQDFDVGMFNPSPVAAPGPVPSPALELPPQATVPTPAPLPAAGSAFASSSGFNVNPIVLTPPRSQGVVLTQARLLLLAGGIVVLMALAFAAGFLCAKVL
jgi:hypothetical protein